MVMVNYNHENTAHHAIHMHGHGFAVMSVGYGPQNVDGGRTPAGVINPEIVCDSALCAAASWNKSRDVYVIQPAE